MASNAPESPPTLMLCGVDRVNQNPLSDVAVTGTPRQLPAPETTVVIRTCKSSHEVTKAMEIDASVSLSFMGDSMSAKTSFSDRLSVTDTSVVVLACTRRITTVWTATDVAAKGDLAAEAAAFVHQFGDSCIDGLTFGWEYYGAYVFHCSTRDEQTKVTASLNANGIFDGVSGDISISTKLSTVTNSTNVAFSPSHTFIGYTPSTPLADPNDVITPALALANMEMTQPAGIISTTTRGYELVDGMTFPFGPVAANRLYFAGDQDIDGLVSKLGRLRALVQTLQTFPTSSDPMTRAVQESMKTGELPFANTAIAAIKAQMSSYRTDPITSYQTPDNVDTLVTFAAGL